jgi:hypothetical protein
MSLMDSTQASQPALLVQRYVLQKEQELSVNIEYDQNASLIVCFISFNNQTEMSECFKTGT